jgi:hypothetical protein
MAPPATSELPPGGHALAGLKGTGEMDSSPSRFRISVMKTKNLFHFTGAQQFFRLVQ